MWLEEYATTYDTKTCLELQSNVASIYMKVAQDAMISATNEIRQTFAVQQTQQYQLMGPDNAEGLIIG